MKTLSRMELAALKRMEKSLKPLQTQLERFDAKIEVLVTERNKVKVQYDKMVDIMNVYTGGVDYKEILHPDQIEESPVAEQVEGELDENAVADMVEVEQEEILEDTSEEELEVAEAERLWQ